MRVSGMLYLMLISMASTVWSETVTHSGTGNILSSAKFDDIGRIVLEDGSVFERVESVHGAPRGLEETIVQPGSS